MRYPMCPPRSGRARPALALVATAALAGAACVPPTVPGPELARAALPVKAPQAATFRAALRVVVREGIAIAAVEAPSGLIQLQRARVAEAPGGPLMATCGTNRWGQTYTAQEGQLTVLVTGDSATSAVQVRGAWWNTEMPGIVMRCTSTGVTERRLEAAIRADAEGAPAVPPTAASVPSTPQ